MNLKNYIRTVPDWPQAGIQFRDITTLLQAPEAFMAACDQLERRYRDADIDKIAAIESRGFIFGAVLAQRLNISLVLVRKPGKLPAETISQAYTLEYGENTLEVHTDAVTRGERVLVVDDLIATGGTTIASIQLIERLGGEIAECAFVIELPDLGGRIALAPHPVFALMSFEGD